MDSKDYESATMWKMTAIDLIPPPRWQLPRSSASSRSPEIFAPRGSCKRSLCYDCSWVMLGSFWRIHPFTMFHSSRTLLGAQVGFCRLQSIQDLMRLTRLTVNVVIVSWKSISPPKKHVPKSFLQFAFYMFFYGLPFDREIDPLKPALPIFERPAT